MASIVKDKNGFRRILFMHPNGKRPTIRLGKVSQRTAEGIKYRIEQLVEALNYKHPVDGDLGQWVANLEPELAKKLAGVGLIAKPNDKKNVTLENFIRTYVDDRTDVKPATKEVWRQGELGLVEFFGADKLLPEITPGDADRYKLHLVGKKLAPMTVRKRLQFATMIFRAAQRHRIISESPFVDVSIKASMPNRERFITVEETQKLLDACPNADWRAIVALSRYGGLRCPSKVLSLRWQDINWAEERIVVSSPKTEHHPGKESRVIPLFPELKSVLGEVLEVAPDGAVYVVDERMRKSSQGKSGWRNCNLRTHFKRIIILAGLKPWERLFHNLRSSRQTELAERFPSHVVCDWLGNSETIARKHYLQTTNDHFSQALIDEESGGAKSGAPAAQNAAQHTRASKGTVSQKSEKEPLKAGIFAALDDSSRSDAKSKNGWRGIRTPGTITVRRFSKPVP